MHRPRGLPTPAIHLDDALRPLPLEYPRPCCFPRTDPTSHRQAGTPESVSSHSLFQHSQSRHEYILRHHSVFERAVVTGRSFELCVPSLEFAHCAVRVVVSDLFALSSLLPLLLLLPPPLLLITLLLVLVLLPLEWRLKSAGRVMLLLLLLPLPNEVNEPKEFWRSIFNAVLVVLL